MNKEQKYQYVDFINQLMSKDEFAKHKSIQDVMRAIRETDDKEYKMDLVKMVVPHLNDMHNDADYMECFRLLMANPNHHAHLFAYWNLSVYKQQRNDLDGAAEALNEMLLIAEKNEEMESQGVAHHHLGRVLMKQNKWMEALKEFNLAMPFFSETKSYQNEASTMYYVALALKELGHKKLAMSKLREASEMAFEQHSPVIAMHTEVVRALGYLQKGDPEAAMAVLGKWYDVFRLML